MSMVIMQECYVTEVGRLLSVKSDARVKKIL